jgi:hypothetical protein
MPGAAPHGIEQIRREVTRIVIEVGGRLGDGAQSWIRKFHNGPNRHVQSPGAAVT